MELKAIAVLPRASKFDERLERDLILELIQLKPETFIFVDPVDQTFMGGLEVDYLTSLDLNGKSYSCDMGFLDDLHRVFYREATPVVFINPKTRDEYNIETASSATARFCSLLERVYPDFKTAFLSAGDLGVLEELEIGFSVREAIERSGHASVLVIFSDLVNTPTYKEVFWKSAGEDDFLPFLDLSVEPVNLPDYKSLLVGIGATDSLRLQAEMLEGEGDECFLLRFVVESIDLKDKEHPEFTTESIIGQCRERVARELEALKANETILQKLVREALRLWLEERKRLDFKKYAEINIEDPEVRKRLEVQRTGVFVTILKDGQLRGSMGTVLPAYANIGEEIVNNAIEAAFFDPQFTPLTPNELEKCVFEIEVLNPLESIEDESELDPKIYGIVVEQGFKRGVVLPGIARIETVEDQLALAKERAGITTVDEFEPMLISRFSVETF